MAWKPTGRPMVRQQRDKWVVRVDGLDTETGKARPRQLGTYKSRRAAQMAATEFAAAGDTGTDRSSVGFLVDQWVASRTDIASKTKMQYEWAAGHIRSGLGSIRPPRPPRPQRCRAMARRARRRREDGPAQHLDLSDGSACRSR